MGTLVTQRVWGPAAEVAADRVSREVERLERLLNFHSRDSELSRFNLNAGNGECPVSPDLLNILEKARACSELSGGSFDVTAGPLVRLWDVTGGEPGEERPATPPEDEIGRALSLVDYRDLNVDRQAGAASLARPGQAVDLGAIAKGYAADRAREIYTGLGVKSAIVDLGGNVATLDSAPGGSPWRVGIQHPAEREGQILGVLRASDESVVTSGDYERFVEVGGTRYHHIVDPATGYPVRGDLASVTIVCADSTMADALATAVFVLGLDRGLRLIGSLRTVEGILVTTPSEGRRIVVTGGLRGRFTPADSRFSVEYAEGLARSGPVL